MTSFVYNQFVAFGSDGAGLERILRGLQAIISFLSSTPTLLTLILSAPDPVLETLGPLRGHINLTRRFIRFFWFLNSFGASYNLYAVISFATIPGRKSSGVGLETWLDILKFTLLGLYGGLESLTLPDLLGIPKMELFGPERTKALNLEAQRCWFLGLSFAILGSLVRITKAFAYAPVPQHGAGYGTGETPNGAVQEETRPAASEKAGPASSCGEKQQKKQEGEEEDDKVVDTEVDEKMDLNAERARLKALVVKRREDMRKWRRQVAFQIRILGRKAICDFLDCLIPGANLGWINVGPGAVAVAMFISTVMTSRDIWQRCGADVAAKRGVFA